VRGNIFHIVSNTFLRWVLFYKSLPWPFRKQQVTSVIDMHVCGNSLHYIEWLADSVMCCTEEMRVLLIIWCLKLGITFECGV